MKQLSRFLKPYWLQTVFAMLLKLVETVLEIVLISYMGQLIDFGIRKNDVGAMKYMAFKMIAISAIGLVAVIVCHKMASKISTNVAIDIRSGMMEKITRFTYREHDRFGSSTLANRFTSDVDMIKDTVAFVIRLVTRAPFLCVGAIIMGVRTDLKLSLIFFIFVPVFALMLGVIMRKSAPLFSKVQAALDRLSIVLMENLSGARVIRALARQESEKKRVEQSTDELANAYIVITKITTWINPLTLFMLNFGVFVVLSFGSFRVDAGGLTQGELYALSDYIVMIASSMVIISNLVTFFTKASASAQRINEIFDTNPSFTYPEISEHDYDNHSSENAVAFHDVSYRYHPDGEDVLSHISFQIPKGSTFAVIGTTGSGKSTVGHLLSRSYEADKGEVLLDGVPVSRYSKADISKTIGVVPQKSVLFSGTIADNLRFGKETATTAEMWEALDIADAKEFVEKMRKGLDEPVRQGGQNYSGGQRQRIAIARAVVKDSPILMLDDSLSALDYRTDARVRKNIHEKRPGTTLILISQRVSSIVSADQILVLERGEMAGVGTHEELLETCETYQELYQSQRKEEEGGEQA